MKTFCALMLVAVSVVAQPPLPTSAVWHTNSVSEALTPNPFAQAFALSMLPDDGSVIELVFYTGTNSITGTNWLRRVEVDASTNGTEFFAEVLKTNLIAGVTNFVIATERKNGIEGVPFNEVMFVPSRSRMLRLWTQAAATIDGPWRTLTNAPPVEVEASEPNEVFRVEITKVP